MSDTSKVWVSNTTDGALDVLSDSSIELIISTTDFASSRLSFFEQIMPDHPDPIRILISEQDKMDNAIDAQTKLDYITRLKSTITLLGTPLD